MWNSSAASMPSKEGEDVVASPTNTDYKKVGISLTLESRYNCGSCVNDFHYIASLAML